MSDTPSPDALAPAPLAKWKARLAPYLPYLTQLALLLLAAAVGAVGHWAGVDPVTIEHTVEVIREVPTAPLPVKGEAELTPVNTDGWTPDAQASAKDAAAAVFRTFADTPAGQVAAGDLPKQVFLWQAEKKLTGQPTPLKDQNPTGACVGFGTTTANERSLAAEIVSRGGDPSEFAHFSEEVTYAGSKVQGAKSLGASVSRGDGSAGVFAKAWVTSVGGMVPKGKYGTLDLTNYDPSRARSWNLSGCPPDLVAVAKKFPVRTAAKVTSWAEAKTALASGYGIAGCATWSYARVRDANGVAAPTREGWNHCMAIDGYYADAGGAEYGHVENSWSNLPDRAGNRTGQPYHSGPTGWGNPTTAGFWATADSLDRALKQGDSFAYSGVTGFPAKKLPLDWFVQRRGPARDRFARLDFVLAF